MKRALLTLGLILGLSACLPDAQVANQNLTTEADNFKLLRKTVFYNVWTDHTKIVWKPQSFIPDIDIKVDVNEALERDHIDD